MQNHWMRISSVSFFETDGYLFEEIKILLTQEFNDISTVNNIIEQIADGENTLNAIANKCHEKDATVLYSLDRLCSVGLVERKHCITEESNKKKTVQATDINDVGLSTIEKVIS